MLRRGVVWGRFGDGAANSSAACPSKKTGFTIVELLVALTVIAVVLTLTLAAVQAARESARRAQCSSNLRQIGIAVQGYLDTYGTFPPGNCWGGFSAHAALLPQMDQAAAYSRLNFSAGRRSLQNLPIVEMSIPALLCPSDAARGSATNYVGNFGCGLQAFGLNGLIRPINGLYMAGENPSAAYLIRAADVSDGLSNTAMFSETRVGNGEPDPLRTLWQTPKPLLGRTQLSSFAAACTSIDGSGIGDRWRRGFRWSFGEIIYTGYNHVLPPNSNSCTNGGVAQEGAYSATSFHSGGVNVLFADAHQTYVNQAIGAATWFAIGSRNGGEAIELF
jgi:prepilin-type N-terminal cleavage/methylation domain-containing protein/prepilin-type processing-associated H-X9-DG protein